MQEAKTILDYIQELWSISQELPECDFLDCRLITKIDQRPVYLTITSESLRFEIIDEHHRNVLKKEFQPHEIKLFIQEILHVIQKNDTKGSADLLQDKPE